MKKIVAHFCCFYWELPEPGEFGALDPGASAGGCHPGLPILQLPMHVCVCGSRWARSQGGVAWGSQLSHTFPADPRSFASIRSSYISPPGKGSCRKCCSCWVSGLHLSWGWCLSWWPQEQVAVCWYLFSGGGSYFVSLYLSLISLISVFFFF